MGKYVKALKKYSWKNLYEALYEKNIGLAREILSFNIKESSSQELYKISALFYTIELGYRDILEKILNKGDLVNILDISRYTLLMRACNKNDEYLDIVKLLLEKGANINEQSPNNETALNIACYNNNWKITEFLLQHGANDCTKKRENSLIYAIRNGQEKIIKLLIKYRKEMVNKSYMGETPLMIACKYSNANVVKCLLNGGARINEVDIYEENALHYAFYNKEHAREILILLIDNGIDINEDDKVVQFLDGVKDIRIKTILEFRKHGIRGVEKFLSSLKEQDKKMCLIYLMVSYMFNETMDKVRDEFRNLLKENSNVVHEIIKKCKKRKLNKEEKTSNCSLNIDIMMELMNDFCAIGDLEIVKSMVNVGVDVNKRDKNGLSALMYAVKENKIDIVRYLLSLDINVNNVDLKGNNALAYAIKNGNLDIIDELISHNININAKDKNGETPLMLSIKEKNIKVMQYLLEKGANTDTKTLYGKSILNFAVSSGDIRLVNSLQSYIKDKSSANKEGIKPKISIMHNVERLKKNKDTKFCLS